jgi:hypothetical protein
MLNPQYREPSKFDQFCDEYLAKPLGLFLLVAFVIGLGNAAVIFAALGIAIAEFGLVVLGFCVLGYVYKKLRSLFK